MSTGLIIVIAVAAIIILALLVMLPRMRASARRKQAERELHSRRQTVAGEHRTAAAERENRAEMAEQKARMAEQAAQRERAEANMHGERADMHERGMADDDLIDESERERFEGVANPREDVVDRDADGHTMDDRARAVTGRDGDAATGEHQQGRQDEQRFERERITDDVRESERR